MAPWSYTTAQATARRGSAQVGLGLKREEGGERGRGVLHWRARVFVVVEYSWYRLGPCMGWPVDEENAS